MRPDDNETFGADLISAMAEIAKNEISEKQLGSSIVAANYSQYFEVWGEDLVDLMRRIALSVAFLCNEPLSTQSDEDVWGRDLLSFLARVSLREEAKLQGRHSGPDIEKILDESSKLATIESVFAYNATSHDPAIRESVATDPRCPEEVQWLLANDDDEKVALALARNHACKPSIFERLIADVSESVHYAVAANPSCPSTVLWSLYGDYADSIVDAILENSAAPSDLLAEFHWYGWGGSDHKNFSRGTFDAYLSAKAKSEDRFERSCVAEREDTPREILRMLAEDPSLNVRKYVAKNPSTPSEVLLRMANALAWEYQDIFVNQDRDSEIENNDDEDFFPQMGARIVYSCARSNPANPVRIAENPLSTPEQLAELSKHPFDDVRMNVAANSKTPTSALESLSKDASHFVRQCVAQNNNVTESILECLALDEMGKVRELVASNRNCPPSLFERFATDASGNVRMSAGANSNS